MPALFFKIDDKIREELDLIREKEGLGNRTATFAFLVKYYLLTKEFRAWDNTSDQDFEKFEKNL